MTQGEFVREAHPVAGIRLGTAEAGIKRQGRKDLLIIEACEGATCAAVFTQNAFCAAPVQVARKHLVSNPRWLLINSGNANAGTGPQGLLDAYATCEDLAKSVGAIPSQVLPFSTGVIGEYLPVEKIRDAIPRAVSKLNESSWESAAQAIMTTDTRPKIASKLVVLSSGAPVTVTGIAKGAGMIQPNMATMLAFVATDAKLDQSLLQELLADVADRTFNCITIDGDTSTNDACVLLASCQVDSQSLKPGTQDYELFAAAVLSVCSDLAEAIVRDGEGATKFIRILVEEAVDQSEARLVAKTIAHSPLVKTAFFASDPNWGRILAAIGRAGCQNLIIDRVSVWLDDILIVENGGRALGYTELQGATVMKRKDITIKVKLGRGCVSTSVLTCDFSYDYVRINAEYRT
jgi:glutamate N-acetyltransferase/amino-acid N-acetyltransferase